MAPKDVPDKIELAPGLEISRFFRLVRDKVMAAARYCPNHVITVVEE